MAATVGSQFIVAGEVVTAANDKQQLQPMVAQVGDSRGKNLDDVVIEILEAGAK